MKSNQERNKVFRRNRKAKKKNRQGRHLKFNIRITQKQKNNYRKRNQNNAS